MSPYWTYQQWEFIQVKFLSGLLALRSTKARITVPNPEHVPSLSTDSTKIGQPGFNDALALFCPQCSHSILD